MTATEDDIDTPAPGITFTRQLELEPDGKVPGRYHVEVSPAWNCPIVPHGGLMAAVAARAMTLELDHEPERSSLRSLTTVYAAQVLAGPVIIDVGVLRRGRSMSQAAATVRSAGAEVGHNTVAVFGGRRPGFEFTDVVMPEVPEPEDCPSFRDPPPPDVEWERQPPFAFWEQVEGRPALGHAPWEEYTPTKSDTASWYRIDQPPMRNDGTLDPLALVTLCDTMPGAVGEKLGRRGPQWYPPSADLTVHLLGEATSEWILGHSRARRAAEGYASLETTLWDPVTGLVAYGTQMMFFVFPNGDGPA